MEPFSSQGRNSSSELKSVVVVVVVVVCVCVCVCVCVSKYWCLHVADMETPQHLSDYFES